MTWVAQCDFQGSVDRECWEAAFNDTLERHPLLTSVVNAKRFWKLSPIRPLIVWLAHGDSLTLKGSEYLDISQSPGIRVWIRHGDEKVQLTVQFHHACCDGVGAVQFLGEWFTAYHSRLGNRIKKLSQSNLGALTQRGRSRGRPVARWLALKSFFSEALKFVTRRIAPLRGDATHAENLFPGLLEHTFSVEATQRIIQNARQADATLNDLLLCDLFITLAEWNRQTADPTRWLQITIPTSLRRAGDLKCPAANLMGYAFMTRREAECRDNRATLLESIRVESASMRRRNVAQGTLNGIRHVSKIPGALSWCVSPKVCRATAVFSNLGHVTRRSRCSLPSENGRVVTGDLTLMRVRASPPLRPKTNAVFMAAIYAGELTITMRADDRSLGRDNSHRLLERFVDRLFGSETKVDSLDEAS